MKLRRLAVALSAVVLACIIIADSPVEAQLTLPSAAPSNAAPGVTQQGQYLAAPVYLDGMPLFRIAELVKISGGSTIASRRASIEGALEELVSTTGTGSHIRTVFDPKTTKIELRYDGSVSVLQAIDATHRVPLPIVTVTSTDAKFNGVTISQLGAAWQTVVQTAITHALVIRQPAVQRQSLSLIVRVGIGLAAASVVVWIVLILIMRRIRELAEEVAARGDAVEEAQARAVGDADGANRSRRRAFAIAVRSVKPRQRLRLYRAAFELLVWATVLAWFIAVSWAIALFPQTTPVARHVVRTAFRVVTTILIAGLINRLIDVLIDRGAGVWEVGGLMPAEDRARRLLRIPTIARTISGFKTFLVVFITALTIMGQVGVPVGSVVTIGGLAAVALSLAAQNFVRDFVNGFLVLFEDQYVVGDFVSINGYSGIVEHLTLRMVQIRSVAGDVITIPHSSVTNVVNQSRNWSRIDYRVPIDPTADVEKAIALIRSVLETLATEDAWRDAIVEPVEWIGIWELSKDWAIVRASIRTAPLRQFALRRELQDRVFTALSHAGIALGAQIPGQV